MQSSELINGKRYPLWQQFVDNKQRFIGKKLQDFGDAMDREINNAEVATTEIVDVRLEPNGRESAMFLVDGKDFGCGFDVRYGGVTVGEEGWVTFHGYGGHTWRIQA